MKQHIAIHIYLNGGAQLRLQETMLSIAMHWFVDRGDKHRVHIVGSTVHAFVSIGGQQSTDYCMYIYVHLHLITSEMSCSFK